MGAAAKEMRSFHKPNSREYRNLEEAERDFNGLAKQVERDNNSNTASKARRR